MKLHGFVTNDDNPTTSAEGDRVLDHLVELAREVEQELAEDERPSIRMPLTITEQGGAVIHSLSLGSGTIAMVEHGDLGFDDIESSVAETLALVEGEKLLLNSHNYNEKSFENLRSGTSESRQLVRQLEQALKEAPLQPEAGVRLGMSFVPPDGLDLGNDVGSEGLRVMVLELTPRLDLSGAGKSHLFGIALLDANNVHPVASDQLKKVGNELCDTFVLCTTDNHIVNGVTGGWNPAGADTSHDQLKGLLLRGLDEALESMVNVEQIAWKSGSLEVELLGWGNTERISHAVMASYSVTFRSLGLTAGLALMAILAGLFYVRP
jgi:predicted neutral ceramidase superfamily lipid hydrolase